MTLLSIFISVTATAGLVSASHFMKALQEVVTALILQKVIISPGISD
jgi:hypothetical protein